VPTGNIGAFRSSAAAFFSIESDMTDVDCGGSCMCITLSSPHNAWHDTYRPEHVVTALVAHALTKSNSRHQYTACGACTVCMKLTAKHI
jgi:hypothetical protein